MQENQNVVVTDNWSSLQQFTAARIALGRTGASLPTKEVLQFKMAHAHARDAVFSLLDKAVILHELQILQLPAIALQSKAMNRHIYLQRPDLGRRLNDLSAQALDVFAHEEFDVCINIADGLSAEAVNHHSLPVIKLLIEKLKQYHLRVAPVCIIEGGRVAISDETGFLLHAKISLILIGERPGLSSPDSLGAYLTYTPQIGNTDEKRNCVSNIRPAGLQYEAAADKIYYLIAEALRLQMSGIALKENYNPVLKSNESELLNT